MTIYPKPDKELHPLVRELFKLLPDAGADFDIAARIRFLSACRAVFDLIYPPTADHIEISADIMARDNETGRTYLATRIGDQPPFRCPS